MKNRFLHILLCLLIPALLLPCTVLADTGPKPSVEIILEGMPQEDYYVTVLSQMESYGPHHAFGLYGEKEIPTWVLEDGSEDPEYPVWQMFVKYKDADGFYFLDDLFEKCAGDDRISWNYYPPETFKLLLYFPKSDTFIESEIYNRYAFKSYYTLDLAGISPEETLGALTLETGNPNASGLLFAFLARMGLTVILEVIIGLLFGFRSRRQLLIILTANVVTQLLLNLGLALAGQRIGIGLFLGIVTLALELLVVLAEAAFYLRQLPVGAAKNTPSRSRIILYACASNAASYGLGLLLAPILPIIF